VYAIRLTKKANKNSKGGGETTKLNNIHIFYEPVRSEGSPGQSPVFPLYRSHKKQYTFGKYAAGRLLSLLLKPVSLYLLCFPGTDLLQAVLRAVLIIRRVFPGRRLISSDNSCQSIRENVNP
jgi:hypothetical protein